MMAGEDKTVLDDEEIQAEVANLDGWDYLAETHELRRVWQFEKFVPTMVFVRTLTNVMDENNHHSDLQLDSRKKTLTVTVTTHSENAITRADVEFAKAVNAAS
ncbi:MAG: pterin-4a-carbinolamine dehydratase [Candidatus Latescibacterota bacterium]|jgi:pterin-4a-carbinolamine dehydratase